MNETAFSITWEPPEDTGGRSDVYYEIECSVNCSKTHEKCSGYCDVLKDQFQDKTATRFSATGLQSTATYTILIFAKNGVSEVAKETNKPLSITIFAGKKQVGDCLLSETIPKCRRKGFEITIFFYEKEVPVCRTCCHSHGYKACALLKTADVCCECCDILYAMGLRVFID